MINEVFYADFIEEKPCLRGWIDDSGKEVLSSKPVSIPLPSSPAPSSLIELIHRLYAEMADPSVETFEDAEDFDVPDELGIEMKNTPYEQNFDHIERSSTPAGTTKESSTVDSGFPKIDQE